MLVPEPVVAIGADIRVQPMRRHVRTCVRVVTVAVGANLSRRPRGGVGAGNGVGKAFLHGADRIHAPSTDHLVEHRIHGVAPAAAVTDRKFGNRTDRERLWNIRAREAIVAIQAAPILIDCSVAALLCFGKPFLPDVIGDETEAVLELVLEFGKQSVVIGMADAVYLLHVRVAAVIRIAVIHTVLIGRRGTVEGIPVLEEVMGVVA